MATAGRTTRPAYPTRSNHAASRPKAVLAGVAGCGTFERLWAPAARGDGGSPGRRREWCKGFSGGWHERALRAGELSGALNRAAKQHVVDGKSTAGSIS
jgi:hypothetical protein